MKCFVVEDSTPMRREIASRLARQPGLSVVGFATSSSQAIVGIAETVPDIVTLDIHLENSSGIDVLAGIRELYPALKILVLTNNADPIYKSRIIAEGADYFFDKASEFDAAIAQCASLVQQSLQSERMSS
jgi:DNA-binding NarL/FixJ family response regulator